MRSDNTKVAPHHPIPAGYSLFHSFELMARSGYQRVAITNSVGQIASVISQSMIIDWMQENVGLLGARSSCLFALLSIFLLCLIFSPVDEQATCATAA